MNVINNYQCITNTNIEPYCGRQSWCILIVFFIFRYCYNSLKDTWICIISVSWDSMLTAASDCVQRTQTQTQWSYSEMSRLARGFDQVVCRLVCCTQWTDHDTYEGSMTGHVVWMHPADRSEVWRVVTDLFRRWSVTMLMTYTR